MQGINANNSKEKQLPVNPRKPSMPEAMNSPDRENGRQQLKHNEDIEKRGVFSRST
jgi:hypothetical protein